VVALGHVEANKVADCGPSVCNRTDVISGGIAMKVALTGSSGFVGSHVLAELVEHGHEVTAIVRNQQDASSAATQGAKAAVVDLYDKAAVVNVLAPLDGSIHTASPGDAKSADLDSAMADAVIEAFSDSGRPHIQISGLWVYGDNTNITETSPHNAPPLVSWKEAIEQRLLSAPGVRAIIPVSGSAYGDAGGGIPGLLLSSPRDDGGNLIMIGEGRQHWVTVHVADLANFFRRALEQDEAHGYYAIGNGQESTVAEFTEAAAVAVGAAGAVPGSDDEAQSRLGEYFAAVLLLDQATKATRARDELGWIPSRPGLVEELRTGSYRR
jgi:nucleoside-diphosphate-sugar epimerase